MSTVTVGIAMSGGVDSTVAASLLRDQGYQVHGFFMLLPLANLEGQLQRVQEVAATLSVPLHPIDLRHQFSDHVIRYFLESYRAGQTPNPCVYCNRLIKFGMFAAIIRSAGMDKIATGHYAGVRRIDDHYAIVRGVDPLKDQSYFLARLLSPQLHDLLFPLGDWTKEQVYHRAGELGFHFQGEESQDVCFLPQGLPQFLTEQGVHDQSGPIVALDGTRLGTHRGVWNYTIGQRRGLGLPDATPWYVVGIEGTANRLVVGKKDDLLLSTCIVHSLQWSHTAPLLPWRGWVQLRSRHTPAVAEVRPSGPDCWQITFDTPQRAITPGQFAAFYEGDRVLGSAVIAVPESTRGTITP